MTENMRLEVRNTNWNLKFGIWNLEFGIWNLDMVGMNPYRQCDLINI